MDFNSKNITLIKEKWTFNYEYIKRIFEML